MKSASSIMLADEAHTPIICSWKGGDVEALAAMVSTGAAHTVVLTKAGKVHTIGSNVHGQ